MDIFLSSLINHYRYLSPSQGSLSAEDLFYCTKNELDAIYKELRAEKQEQDTGSLLSQKQDVSLDVRLAVVQQVFQFKLEAENQQKNNQEKARLMSLLGKKQEEAEMALTADELQERIKALN